MDCILSYHLNPTTCGVARFNLLLAQKLGIPLLSVFDDAAHDYRAPLVSLKLEEVLPAELSALDVASRSSAIARRCGYSCTRLMAHQHRAETRARGGDRVLRKCRAAQTRSAHRADAIELWCPGTMLSQDLFPAVELSVFSFGMAHKVRSDYYRRLQQLAGGDG